MFHIKKWAITILVDLFLKQFEKIIIIMMSINAIRDIKSWNSLSTKLWEIIVYRPSSLI